VVRQRRRPSVHEAAEPALILLDTNAFIWLHLGHRRASRLLRSRRRLYVSPATLLELAFLAEAGRIRLRSGIGAAALIENEPWPIDDPPAVQWFTRAADVVWTRDPFDRLLVAHAQLRGWRLATGDGHLLRRLGPSASVDL